MHLVNARRLAHTVVIFHQQMVGVKPAQMDLLQSMGCVAHLDIRLQHQMVFAQLVNLQDQVLAAEDLNL